MLSSTTVITSHLLGCNMSQLESTVCFKRIRYRFRTLETIIVAQQFKIISSYMNARHNVFFLSNPVLKHWNLAESFTHTALECNMMLQCTSRSENGVSSFRSFSGAFAKLRKATGRIFIKFGLTFFFFSIIRPENSSFVNT